MSSWQPDLIFHHLSGGLRKLQVGLERFRRHTVKARFLRIQV